MVISWHRCDDVKGGFAHCQITDFHLKPAVESIPLLHLYSYKFYAAISIRLQVYSRVLGSRDVAVWSWHRLSTTPTINFKFVLTLVALVLFGFFIPV